MLSLALERDHRAAPNPHSKFKSERSPVSIGNRLTLGCILSTWFQDPGNKIFELQELSVFSHALRKIQSWAGSSAELSHGGAPSAESTSWDSLYWAAHCHSLRTHQHCCELFRQADATAIVRNRASAAAV